MKSKLETPEDIDDRSNVLTRVTPPVNPGHPNVEKTPSSSMPTVLTKSSSGNTLHEVPADLELDNLESDVLLALAPRQRIRERSQPHLDCVVLARKLGQGGMGAVYLGFHRRLGKKVAVKVLPLQGMLDAEKVQRFYREAQLAAQVHSPHLVSVLDVNEQHGLSYIVMELVDGPSALNALLRARREGQRGLPEALALEIGIAAARGLSVAHAAGIIHRDLKPDNILMPWRNSTSKDFDASSAKIADLGLARREGADPSITASGDGMGTPGFMAPEQAMSAGTAGKPADVFGLGASIYALLCGHAPFHDAEAMRIIVATLQEPHAPARSVRADISITTSALLDRCLHKDPEDRFADGAALLCALQECLGALAAPPEKQQEIVARWNSCLPVPPQKTEAFELPAPKKPGSSTKITLLDSAVVVLKRGAERLAYWRAMSRGQSLLKRAKWTQAEESFRAALTAIPGDKKAEDGIQAALSGASDTRFEMAFAEAEEAAKTNDWELARVAYQRALSERPQHARAISGRGLALYQKAMLAAQAELKDLCPERGHYPELEHGRRNRVEVALAEALKALPGDKAAADLLEQIGDPGEVSLDLGGGIVLPLVRVKHGAFEMGSAEGGQLERPARKVRIERTFYLARTPITVKQYRRFIASSRYETAAEVAGKGLGIGRQGEWELIPGLNWKNPGYDQTDDHPAVLLSWFDAHAFCFWVAKNAIASWTSRQQFMRPSLPSEAQWEFAARGAQSFRYAWGQLWDGAKANHADVSLSKRGVHFRCSNDNDGYPFTAPVGRYTNASWCGAQDMIGNVWEWCQDWHHDDYYHVAPEANPTGPETGMLRAMRGGSWADMPLKCRAYSRRGAPPEGIATNVGFRLMVSFQPS